GLGVARDPVEDLVVRLDARAGRRLTGVVRVERGRAEDAAGDADRLDPLAPVLRGREVVEAERGMLARIGVADLDRAARVRVHRANYLSTAQDRREWVE